MLQNYERKLELIKRIVYEPSTYVKRHEDSVYRDGLKHKGEHLDWLEDPASRDLDRDLEAIIRHLEEFRLGNLVDPDSGAHPLAHVRARCGIIMDVEYALS